MLPNRQVGLIFHCTELFSVPFCQRDPGSNGNGDGQNSIELRRAFPFKLGRPSWPGQRIDAGSEWLASRRKRVIRHKWRRTAPSSSNAQKRLSAPTASWRSGSQRQHCRIGFRAQSIRALWRRLWFSLQQAGSAKAVRNGSVGRWSWRNGGARTEPNCSRYFGP